MLAENVTFFLQVEKKSFMCLIFLQVLKFLFSLRRKVVFHWDYPKGHIQVYRKKNDVYLHTICIYLCRLGHLFSGCFPFFLPFPKELNI